MFYANDIICFNRDLKLRSLNLKRFVKVVFLLFTKLSIIGIDVAKDKHLNPDFLVID